MSRRRKIILLLIVIVLLLLVRGGACRDPDPPTHPVPVDYDESNTPIAAPAAK